MTPLFDKIELIYPGITNNYNIIFNPPFELSDYGNGPVISVWNDERPQPTQEQLDAIE